MILCCCFHVNLAFCVLTSKHKCVLEITFTGNKLVCYSVHTLGGLYSIRPEQSGLRSGHGAPSSAAWEAVSQQETSSWVMLLNTLVGSLGEGTRNIFYSNNITLLSHTSYIHWPLIIILPSKNPNCFPVIIKQWSQFEDSFFFPSGEWVGGGWCGCKWSNKFLRPRLIFLCSIM